MDSVELKKKSKELNEKAGQIRTSLFNAIANAGGGHFGGTLSIVEILTALYFGVMKLDPKNPNWEDRDRFILAKGHGGPALYIVLSELGYFPKEWLCELDQGGGRLPKHVDRLKTPGIEFSSGPLGQGLSVAVGMALAAKLDTKDINVYVLMGDGECNEGQVWEAAMSAAKYGLGNIIAFIDRNNLQIDGTSDEVMPLGNLSQKWESFGWEVLTVDGHNILQILEAVNASKRLKNKPTVIIANTVKGKGVSFMENRYEWHSGNISNEQHKLAITELENAEDN